MSKLAKSTSVTFPQWFSNIIDNRRCDPRFCQLPGKACDDGQYAYLKTLKLNDVEKLF